MRDDTPAVVCVECGADGSFTCCMQCDAHLCDEHYQYSSYADENFCEDPVACVVRFEAAKKARDAK